MFSLPAAFYVLSLSLPLFPLPYDYDRLFTPSPTFSETVSTQSMHRDPEKEFNRAVAAYKNGRWEEATMAFAPLDKELPIVADYVLLLKGEAHLSLKEYDQALASLLVAKESPAVRRRAELLAGQALFEKGEYQAALELVGGFGQRHQGGSDSTKARLIAARCAEALGDKTKAASDYRSLWLEFPASPEAQQADEGLRRLTEDGIIIPSYTPEELFLRAETLLKQRQHDAAIAALKKLSSQPADERLKQRIALKLGEALLDSRRFKEAEQFLGSIARKDLQAELLFEQQMLLGRALQRNNKDEEAIAIYLAVADSAKSSPIGHKALYQAAQLRKFQGRHSDSLLLIDRLLALEPEKSLKVKALWDAGWTRYLNNDHSSAATFFRRLLAADGYTDSALYWLARSLEKSGRKEEADKTWKQLIDGYPFGFYALRYKQERGIADTTPAFSTFDIKELLPSPTGLDRIRILAAAGLQEDAKKEIALAAPSPSRLELARLYIDLGDYRTPMTLFPRERLRRIDGESMLMWGINYPCGYRESVSRHAAAREVSESLVFSIIRQESNYYVSAVSRAGAVGLMQLMPATAKALAKGETIGKEELCIPDINISLGVRHLSNLLAAYKGNEILAVAAYNAGSGNVEKWRKNFGHLAEDEFIENIPFLETREYVKKVMAGKAIYETIYSLQKKESAKPREPKPPSLS